MILAACLSISAVTAQPAVVHTRDGGRYEAQGIQTSASGLTITVGDQLQLFAWHHIAHIEGSAADVSFADWFDAGDDVWRAHRRIDRLDAVASVPPLERALNALADQAGPSAAAAHGADLRWCLLVGDPGRGLRAWAAMHRAAPAADLDQLAPGALDATATWCPRLPPLWPDPDAALAHRGDFTGDSPPLLWYAHLASLQANQPTPRPEPIEGPVGAFLSASAEALSQDPAVRQLGRRALEQLSDTTFPDEPEWLADWATLARGVSLALETEGGSRENAARAIAQVLLVDARSGGASPLTPLALAMARDIADRSSMPDTAATINAELAARYPGHPLAGASTALALRRAPRNGD